MLQFLKVEWVYDTFALEKAWAEEHASWEHPRDSRFVEAHSSHWFDDVFPLVPGHGGGNGWVSEGGHDGAKPACPCIVPFQACGSSVRVGELYSQFAQVFGLCLLVAIHGNVDAQGFARLTWLLAGKVDSVV